MMEHAGLHSLPVTERPRERLLKHGVEALSLTELLAILLVTGTKGKSVVHLAQEMLSRFGNLNGLLEASIEELMEIKGVGKAKAVQLKAAFGIALKNSRFSLSFQHRIDTPREVFEYIKDELADKKQEVLVVILRDVKGRVMHTERVSMGTLSEVLIHPREIFYPAVRHKAHSLVVAHNHPSGDPTPSLRDIELTRLLLQSGQVMGITLDDHVIIGHGAFVSLRERGVLGTPSSSSY